MTSRRQRELQVEALDERIAPSCVSALGVAVGNIETKPSVDLQFLVVKLKFDVPLKCGHSDQG